MLAEIGSWKKDREEVLQQQVTSGRDALWLLMRVLCLDKLSPKTKTISKALLFRSVSRCRIDLLRDNCLNSDRVGTNIHP